MLPMRPNRAQSTQAGTAGKGIPRIRYAVPAMLCVTLNVTLNWSREADSEHEFGYLTDGC